MRTKLIAGNWKMNMTVSEARCVADAVVYKTSDVSNAEIVICPPYTALYVVAEAIRGSNIALGAQDVFWHSSGAFTSQISPRMLKDVGCTYTIIGHSETRGRFGNPDKVAPGPMSYFAESDKSVNVKVRAALEEGLKCIVCVGENSEEKAAGRTEDVIRTQIEVGLSGLRPEQVASLVIAYEPVWAIDTGKACDSSTANSVCRQIRLLIESLYGPTAAESLRVLYGGSVNAENAKDFLEKPDIDGVLVGGASLKPDDFATIAHSCPK